MADDNTLQRAFTSYALYVALGVVVGVIAAPVFAGAVGQDGADGTVAVIPVEGEIDGDTAADVSAALAEARSNESIDAVVIVANSGGGGAAASEEMYFAVKRTAASGTPVMATVDAAAASGAYYTIAPAERIFVKPASNVGSVGVLAQLPDDIEPNELVGASGPNKLSGSDTREFLTILDSLQTAFVNAVIQQRSDSLTLSRSDVEQARIYSGGQAVQNGMADEIGDRQAAIQAAAEEAGLDSYSVRVLEPDNGTTTFVSRSAYMASDDDAKRLVSANRVLANDTGGPVFLMVGGVYLSDSNEVVSASAVNTSAANATETTDEQTATPNAVSTPTGIDLAPDARSPADPPRVEVNGGGLA